MSRLYKLKFNVFGRGYNRTFYLNTQPSFSKFMLFVLDQFFYTYPPYTVDLKTLKISQKPQGIYHVTINTNLDVTDTVFAFIEASLVETEISQLPEIEQYLTHKESIIREIAKNPGYLDEIT